MEQLPKVQVMSDSGLVGNSLMLGHVKSCCYVHFTPKSHKQIGNTALTLLQWALKPCKNNVQIEQMQAGKRCFNAELMLMLNSYQLMLEANVLSFNCIS